ncbi:MAG: J domain-containing protein [Spirochaetes bacterium]|nr:J domain-containing protein [Spirochaetota bacterium]
MVEHKTLYDILDVPESASPDEIKSSFRHLAKTWHPDMNNNSDESKSVFQLISNAYHVLIDDDRRREYDIFLRNSSVYRLRKRSGAAAGGIQKREIVDQINIQLNYVLWEIEDIFKILDTLSDALVSKIHIAIIEILHFIDIWILHPAGHKDYFYDSRRIVASFNVYSLSGSMQNDSHRPYVDIHDYYNDIRKRMARFGTTITPQRLNEAISPYDVTLNDTVIEAQMLSYHNLGMVRRVIDHGMMEMARYTYTRQCYSGDTLGLLGR